MSDGTLNLPHRTIAPSSPSIGRSKIWVDSNNIISSTDSNGITKSATSLFGSFFNEAENEVSMSLSTLSPTSYLTMITPNLPLGKYRVGYNFTWNYDDISGNAAHFALYDNGVRHNNEDIAMETKNIFDDAHVGTFVYLDNTSGIRTISIMVNCDNILDTVVVKNAYIEIWRVA